MKTTPFARNVSTVGAPRFAVDDKFYVRINGQELEMSLFGALYAVVTLVRDKLGVEVASATGEMLLVHDGRKTIHAVVEFEQAVSGFEAFLVAEQKAGYDLALKEFVRRAERSGLNVSEPDAAGPAGSEEG